MLLLIQNGYHRLLRSYTDCLCIDVSQGSLFRGVQNILPELINIVLLENEKNNFYIKAKEVLPNIILFSFITT